MMKKLIAKLMIAGGIITMLSAPGNDSFMNCSFVSIAVTAITGALITAIGALVYEGEKR